MEQQKQLHGRQQHLASSLSIGQLVMCKDGSPGFVVSLEPFKVTRLSRERPAELTSGSPDDQWQSWDEWGCPDDQGHYGGQDDVRKEPPTEEEATKAGSEKDFRPLILIYTGKWIVENSSLLSIQNT